VQEPRDPAGPARSAARPTQSRPSRARKFVLPDHHHDERADERAAEHIGAFIDGGVAPNRHTRAIERPRRPLELDTRQDWTAALRHEGARHARYGRPASVLLIELGGQPHEQAVDRIARALANVIRAEARETDRAVRIATLRFRLLLPETGGRAARTLAERLDRAFSADPDGRSNGVALQIEVATAARNGTLEDALAEAEARIAAKTP
jgi:GGDEF domain-containing protein